MRRVLRGLRRMGVLGLNARNCRYIAEHNPRRLYPLVDDKLLTKRLAAEAGMAVPELYGVVRIQREVKELGALLAPYDDFVIKPAHGSGGNGILVAAGRQSGRFRTAGGALVELRDVQHYVSNIVSGAYSLGGHPDAAMIEYCVQFDPVFEKICHQGVPDVRIIVHLGFPVMAMVRLPTRVSDGKANLHQGAIGAGVCLRDGRTLTAVWRDEIVTEHPDTGHPVGGVEIPHWPELLRLAARCYELTGLGYLGVDLVLDRHRGPLILELNARPGLAVQIANQAGLEPRLRAAQIVHRDGVPIDERVEWARDAFYG
ncbi:MAG: alpha-L-glutamate ligase-like protein [Acidobacteriota bacterium]|nr:alpha-L-glutamate ligase-like protein [Acidobacteriota bacterium]